MDGFISKLQRYSTNDGPGIRTTVFAVGCPLSCLWCANPELIGDAAKFLYHPRRCVGCGACVAKSNGAIRLTEEGLDIDRETADLEECSVVCYYDAYERIGGIATDKELVTGLLRDKAFYDQSGGGVTFSGGDPGMQPEFFYEVATRLRDFEVHTALDTSGYFPWEKLAPLVSAVDLVLYDIKTLNRTLHKRYTGVDNQLILENAMRITDMGKAMTVRMILIPGVNDSDDEIIGRLKFIKKLGNHVKLDLIKYHKLGAGKYASLGMIEMMEGTPECTGDLAEYAANHARNMGIAVSING
ncbi:MAG: glycyl-radical enzyme activating protein [Oscillospiraceae bacterium]|nr:glycyl-radical enzyme activating protein [Oscillospiraceae bacterium]